MSEIPNPAVVDTTAGKVRGQWESGLAVFRGIPYAAAPVGQLRWRATQPHQGWDGVRDAIEHGPISPQPTGMPYQAVLGSSGQRVDNMDEDCLSLGVWTPGVDNGRRPVFVYIHGGGHTTGAGSWEINSPEPFARNGDVVAVSINYRIGPFGYLFIDEADGTSRGNFWLEDVIAALRWVQENIANFGGDPATVTVGGYSGGALCIAWLMGLPVVRGLFSRAILESAPMGFGAQDIDKSRTLTGVFFDILGVSTVAEARAMPADDLVRAIGPLRLAWARTAHDPNLNIPPFWDVIDEVSLSRQPLDALADGSDDVDMLIGWTREEFSLFCAPPRPVFADLTREQAVARARLNFGDSAEAAYDEWAKARPGATPTQVLIDIMTDGHLRMGNLLLAELRAAQGHPTYVYQFDWQSPMLDGFLGATHDLDLPFKFDNFEIWGDSPMLAGTESPQRQALADAMHAAWIAFIRTGDPNHDSLPGWDPYTPVRRTTMRFDTVTQPVDDLVGHWRRAWHTFGGRLR
jgi:carboxylesterase type B